MTARLNERNFEKGMLIDDDWMAGIAKENEGFSAFVVDHRSGGLVAQQCFEKLAEALDALNRLPRDWKYEATGGCAGDRCAEGQCKGTGCKIYRGPRDAGASPPSCGSSSCA